MLANATPSLLLKVAYLTLSNSQLVACWELLETPLATLVLIGFKLM
jgi:hypothetical protein